MTPLEEDVLIIENEIAPQKLSSSEKMKLKMAEMKNHKHKKSTVGSTVGMTPLEEDILIIEDEIAPQKLSMSEKMKVKMAEKKRRKQKDELLEDIVEMPREVLESDFEPEKLSPMEKMKLKMAAMRRKEEAVDEDMEDVVDAIVEDETLQKKKWYEDMYYKQQRQSMGATPRIEKSAFRDPANELREVVYEDELPLGATSMDKMKAKLSRAKREHAQKKAAKQYRKDALLTFGSDEMEPSLVRKNAYSNEGFIQGQKIYMEGEPLTYNHDMQLLDDVFPLLDEVYFSNIPPQRMREFNPLNETYYVDMYLNEPTVVGGYSHNYEVMVDQSPFDISSDRMGSQNFAFATFRPRGRVGDVLTRNIHTTNMDRSNFRKLEIVGRLVPSVSPKVAKMIIPDARLDPPFSPSTYSYYVRADPRANSVTLDFTMMNDLEGKCVYEGALGVPQVFSGFGVLKVPLLPNYSRETIVLTCTNADESQLIRYLMTVVPQRGFTTLLSGLDVFGATLNPPFSPFFIGPYKANMVEGSARDMGREIEWMQIIATSPNPGALVTVEGHEVDRVTHLSPWFRVPRGETRRFRVAIRTPENPVAEEYVLHVSRQNALGKHSECSALPRYIGNLLGYATSLMSSQHGWDYLHNAKYLQSTSFAGKENGMPEVFETYAQGFDPFNLQPKMAEQFVHVVNGTEIAELAVGNCAYSKKGCPWGYGGRRVDPYKLSLIGSSGSSSSGSSMMQRIDDELRNLGTMLDLDSKSGKWIDAWNGVVNRQAVVDSVARPSVTEALASPRRSLLALTPQERLDAISKLDAARKDLTRVVEASYTLTATNGALLGLGALYTILWFVYLADPTAKLQTGTWFSLRRDYPMALHPTRFWNFFGDLALVANCQAAATMFTVPSALAAHVSVFGYVVPIAWLKYLSYASVCLIPGAYMGFIGYTLFTIKQHMVYSTTMCEYHDRFCPEAKAFYDSRYTRLIPFFRHLFRWEIRSVIPIMRAPDANAASERIFFEDDQSPMFSGAWNSNRPEDAQVRYTTEEGSVSGYSPIEPRSSPARYDKETGELYACIDDEAFDNQEPGYHKLATALYSQYPEAQLGHMKYRIVNPYDTLLDVVSELQVRHLRQLLHLGRTALWLPKKNMQFDQLDRWAQITKKAQKGNFYYWLVDRATLMAVIFATAFWKDSEGLYTTGLFSAAMLVVAASCVPGAVSSGSAKWTRLMEAQLDDEAVLDEAEVALAREVVHKKERENVWPFTEPGMRERFDVINKHKQDARWYGMHKVYTDYMVAPANKLYRSKFWDTRTWLTMQEVAKGPAGTELLKSEMLLMALVGNKFLAKNAAMGNWMSWGAVLTSVAGLSFLNYDPARETMGSLKLWYEETRSFCTEYAARTVGALTDPSSLGDRFKWYGNQAMLMVKEMKLVSFSYPKGASSIRDCQVHHVNVVSNELGLQFPGRVVHRKRLEKTLAAGKQKCRMYKTLVMRSVGGHRSGIFDTLPVEKEVGSFFNNQTFGYEKKAERLAATVQIANYARRGAELSALPPTRNGDHDSYLSLYTNKLYFPPAGQIKTSSTGHNYSVRYEPDLNQISIRGPEIMEGVEYTVKTMKKGGDEPDKLNDDTSSSSSSSNSRGSRGSKSYSSKNSFNSHTHVEEGFGEAVCERPGCLTVLVPPGQRPDMHKLFTIMTPREQPVLVNPNIVKVMYDCSSHELFIRSKEISQSLQPYRVRWTCRPRESHAIHETAVATEAGILHVPLSGEFSPDLTGRLEMRERDGRVVDIDCRQTDAYSYFGAAVPADNDFDRLVATVTGHAKTFWSFLTGRTNSMAVTEEPVPCTIIQCINPLEQTYRVDPNFHELHRMRAARLAELEAQQTAVDSSAGEGGSLVSVWPSLIMMEEYVSFWRHHGVEVLREDGELIDPLLLENGSVYEQNGLMKKVAAGEQDLRGELSLRIQGRVNRLQSSMEDLRVWIRGYSDPELHNAQNERDRVDWARMPDADIKAHGVRLSQLKKTYESQAPGFVYPCNIQGSSIVRRPNMTAQFKEWQETLENWLQHEEGVDARLSLPFHRAAASVVTQVMQTMKYCLIRQEHVSAGIFKSVLHYVVGSHLVRGPAASWLPDPLAAHPAEVRIWRDLNSNDCTRVPNVELEPEWMPCLLKLTGNNIKMLIPNKEDAGRYPVGTMPWQKVHGLQVPLLALQKLELVQEESVEDLVGRTTKLVCRKNQQLPVNDAYVLGVDNDAFNNLMSFNLDSGTVDYRALLGFTVPRSELYKYPTAEVDPTIDCPDVNVYPLTFRFDDCYAQAWQRAISQAAMDKPHSYEFNGVMGSPTPRNEEVMVTKPVEVLPAPTITPIAETVVVATVVQELTNSSVDHKPSSSSLVEALVFGEDIPRDLVCRYEGGLENGLYHGEGTLYNENDVAVYRGGWNMGMRQGEGECRIRDPTGDEWLYRGTFVNDVPCGEATMMLADPRALEMLQAVPAENAGPVKRRLTRYSGVVAPTAEAMSPLPMVPEHLVNQVFPENVQRSGVNETVMIDLRRKANKNNKAVYEQSWFSEVEAAMARGPGEFDTSVDDAEARELCALAQVYMPHKLRWSVGDDVFRRLDRGVSQFADGSMFEGSLNNLQPGSEGKFYAPFCNVRVDGSFVNGSPEGECLCSVGSADGEARECYRGPMFQGARVGTGVATALGEKIYIKGTWVADQLADGPVQIFIDPEHARKANIPVHKIVGTMNNGMLTGRSRVSMAAGMRYEGGLEGGMRNGPGKIYDANGEVIYEGTFANDLPHGRCTRWVLPQGQVYCGQVSHGLRRGLGELYDVPKVAGQPGAQLYDGLWDYDVPDGRGMAFLPDGEYEGEFQAGRRSGKGRFKYLAHPAGNKPRVYEGDWLGDKPDGSGKYLSENGIENVYKFSKGEIVESSKNEYKPMCGSSPETGVGPAVLPLGIGATPDKYWSRQKPFEAGGLAKIIALVSKVSPWKLYERANYKFVPPTETYPIGSVDPNIRLERQFSGSDIL